MLRFTRTGLHRPHPSAGFKARTIACVFLFCALVAHDNALAQAVQVPSAPRVIASPDGGADVIFGNDCIVSFDRKGRESRRLPTCTAQQVQQAQQLDAQRRVPPVTELGGGFVRVQASRNCSVMYNPSGQREGTPRECSSSELSAADASVQEYRRAQGLSRPGGGVAVVLPSVPGKPGVAPPNAGTNPPVAGTRSGRFVELGEAAEVYFDNGCVARIEAFGQKAKPHPRCSIEQLKRAEQLMGERAIQKGGARSGEGS